jgi:hypothetical protein
MHAGLIELAGAFQLGGRIKTSVHSVPKLGDLAGLRPFNRGILPSLSGVILLAEA